MTDTPTHTPLTVEAVSARPDLATFAIEWQGEPITFRPLQAGDAEQLGRYFESLSPITTDMFGPHPFTMDTARGLCAEIGLHDTVRMVALRGPDADGAADTAASAGIVAYFILRFGLPNWGESQRYAAYGIALDERTCGMGPSVADALQGQGMATALMACVRELARRFGCTCIILMGGVFVTNARAIRFYEKVGFRKLGTFSYESRESYDMMLRLP